MEYRIHFTSEYQEIAAEIMDAAYKIYEALNDHAKSCDLTVNEYWGNRVMELIVNEVKKAESEWDLD